MRYEFNLRTLGSCLGSHFSEPIYVKYSAEFNSKGLLYTSFYRLQYKHAPLYWMFGLFAPAISSVSERDPDHFLGRFSSSVARLYGCII